MELDRPVPIPKDLNPTMSWFASWFKHHLSIEDSVSHVFSWRMGGGETCFLGDADSMVLRPEFLHQTMDEIKKRFPTLKRFTVYGKTRMAARNRSLKDLKGYHEAGLHRIHFGLESGSDIVLGFVKKGCTKADHIEAGRKTDGRFQRVLLALSHGWLFVRFSTFSY